MCRHWYKMATSMSYRRHRWVGKNFSSQRNAIRMACLLIESFPEWIILRSLPYYVCARSSNIREAALSRLADIMIIQRLKLEEYHDGRLDDTAGGS